MISFEIFIYIHKQHIFSDYIIFSIKLLFSFYLRKHLMGIDGLLTFLKPIVQSEHISSFSGKTLGIDAFPWLYKGCYSYVQEYQMDLS